MNKLIIWTCIFLLCISMVFATAPAGTATHTQLYTDEIYSATGTDVVVGGSLGTWTNPISSGVPTFHLIGSATSPNSLRLASAFPNIIFDDTANNVQGYLMFNPQFVGNGEFAYIGPNGWLAGIPEFWIDSNGFVWIWPYTSGGQLNVANICDETGANCKTISQGWMAGAVASAVSLTSTTYNGQITSGTLTGYEAANAICNAAVAGSHLCTTDDILAIIATTGPATAFSGLTNGWIAEGPPGDVAPANDCVGWTSSSSSQLGPYWAYSTGGGGAGWLTNCAQTKPLSCCK